MMNHIGLQKIDLHIDLTHAII